MAENKCLKEVPLYFLSYEVQYNLILSVLHFPIFSSSQQ